MSKAPSIPAKPLRAKTVPAGFKVNHRPPTRQLTQPARLPPIVTRQTKKS